MQTWILIAFIAPILWAFVVLLDIYFTQKAYSEATEGTIISGLYQGIVLFAIPFVGYSWPSSGWMFFASGMLFLFSCHWYLRSLVIGGDGAISQIVWNFSIVLVPIFAWVISGEELQIIHYIGIILAFIGIAFFGWDKKILNPNIGRIVKNMIPAIVALSISMNLQKEGFNRAPQFFPGLFTFSFGIVAGGAGAFILNSRKKDIGMRIVHLCRRYWYSFFLGETLSVIALFSSSYAISLSPSISFIIVIESLVPIFVMIFSLFLSWLFFVLQKSEYRLLYKEQVNNMRGKFGATIMIAIAIYLIA